jgi:protein SCO1/2
VRQPTGNASAANGDVVNSRTDHLITLALAVVVGGALVLGGVFFGTFLQLRLSTQTTSRMAAIGGPFTLVATNGQNVSEQTFRGKWVLMYFGYTFCPDACPTALNNISVAMERLGPEAGKLQPVFVTVDPQRDTREVMADYLKSFDSRILGLTGTKNEIDKVIKEFHLFVSAEKSEGHGNDYYVSHSSYIYLIDPRGSFVDVIHGGAVGDDIAIWLRKEIREAGS